jgi:hypothetical protein
MRVNGPETEITERTVHLDDGKTLHSQIASRASGAGDLTIWLRITVRTR